MLKAGACGTGGYLKRAEPSFLDECIPTGIRKDAGGARLDVCACEMHGLCVDDMCEELIYLCLLICCDDIWNGGEEVIVVEEGLCELVGLAFRGWNVVFGKERGCRVGVGAFVDDDVSGFSGERFGREYRGDAGGRELVGCVDALVDIGGHDGEEGGREERWYWS